MSEEDANAAVVETVEADATDDVTPNTRLRFVLTVEGDGETATIKAEAWKYANDGTLVEAAPVKEREADNIVVALYDSGFFFQTTSLLMGRTMALASGDLLRAIQIDVMAGQLGMALPPLTDEEPTETTEEMRAAVESIFADTISKALAG